MLSPPKNEGEHRPGLLIDFDYAFLMRMEHVVAQIKEHQDNSVESSMAQQHQNDDAKSPEAQRRALLLHRTVHIFIKDIITKEPTVNDLQGTLPFMAIELLMDNKNLVEHTEKHDLESLFYVLLYICTMCTGPGKLSKGLNRDDNYHPFGNWIDDVADWHAIGAYKSQAFTDPDVTDKKVFKHVHPYFKPLIPLLRSFCDTIFPVYLLESPSHADGISQRHRGTNMPCGTHQDVLKVLRNAFDELPDDDGDLGLPEGEPEVEPEVEPMGPPTHTPRMYTHSGVIPTRQWAIAKKTGDPNFGYGSARGIFAPGSDSGYEEDNTSPSGIASGSDGRDEMQHRVRHLRAKRSSRQSTVDSGFGEEASTSSSTRIASGSTSGDGDGNNHHSSYSSNKRSSTQRTVDIMEPLPKRRRDGHSRSLPSA